MKSRIDYEIVFLQWSVDEIENAEQWYSQRKAGLGNQFMQSIIQAIESLQSDTVERKAVYRGLSKVMARQFPYIIYFKKDITSKRIVIYGILHNRQSRSNLRKRF